MWAWLAGLAGFASLCSIYVFVEIANPSLVGPSKPSVVQSQTSPDSTEHLTVNQVATGSVVERKGPISEQPRRDPETFEPTKLDRREEAQRRAQQRSTALREFYESRPRNGWAAETEIALRDSLRADDIAFDEIGCRAGICCVVAIGEQRDEIFRTVSQAANMKTFSRVLSETDGTMTVESFMSPAETQWPVPQGS
jgi:hypothetical protein